MFLMQRLVWLVAILTMFTARERSIANTLDRIIQLRL